ncbi:activating signal cointegrator 1 complex subunit 3 [Diplogelasinospora grovesii]|uniref:Activating signal cointegrator 1 complex subunit 3 n=1 Tax=Diplogelasinospora grovesii TaxID=303347 RepID=A0AAN6S7D8_9PEZI|nr:activating signal cointegrator 1 complex subunit 3 [Diplogelasinospora grovesii]
MATSSKATPDVAAWRAQMEAMKASVTTLPPAVNLTNGEGDVVDWDDDDSDYTYTSTSPSANGGLGVRDVWDFISDDELDGLSFDESDGGASALALADGEELVYGWQWLSRRCTEVSSRRGGLSADVLQSSIMDILGSSRPEEELQGGLTDLVGFDDIDFVIELLAHRDEIVTSQQQQQRTGQDSQRMGVEGVKLMNKRERDEALRRADLAHKSTPLAAARSREEQYPHVYKSYSAGNTLSAAGSRYALPIGSERKEYDKYEEYSIPAGKTGTLLPGHRLVEIKEMDGLCRNTFRGYKALNRMQSLVYPVAYKTSENMLICAPTGAGKTDAAMLTILHTIGQYLTPNPWQDCAATDFAVRADDFKIIYVAPMKALAAEITEKLGKRLAWLGIRCREYTGDMHLTKSEIVQTQVIVTTPEKWDVVTRKGTGDTELVQKVRLLIIDEVHMLHDERGAVLESLVARTERQVESTQSLIRIVGLSATLPNYIDVAEFLRVNKYAGLFYFDASFRPVPLEQHFIGVKGKAGTKTSRDNLDQVAFDKVREMLELDHQVMVFVHSRRDTQATAKMLHEKAVDQGCTGLFDPSMHDRYEAAMKDIKSTRAREIRELVPKGLGIHHAGMARSDRNLMERLFAEGVIKVLCCTATLAWGVNLPAAAVVIKGTQVYSAQDGKFVDLGILDVLQIFGRAGRPQFEDVGIGMICTTQDKLAHYLTAVTDQLPIESRFSAKLVDNLNAEIALGTVTSIPEAVEWIGYSYLFVRMKKNPMAYGIEWAEYENDRSLVQRRRKLAIQAARTLQQSQMIIFNEATEELRSKDIGRIASQFYIQQTSIQIFNSMMNPHATEGDVLKMIAMSGEFDNIQLRNTEVNELSKMKASDQFVPIEITGGIDQPQTKTNILLQTYISKGQPEDFALTNDLNYVAQQAGRICRALFMIALNRRWGYQCLVLLTMAKSIERRIWYFEHPLNQFDLPKAVLQQLEAKQPSIESMREMEPAEIGALVNHHRMGTKIANVLSNFPTVSVEAEIAPLNRDVLRIKLYVTPDFRWNDHIHGTSESYYIWVENSETSEIYHHEFFILNRRKLYDDHELNFTIPLSDPLPTQIYVRAVSDRWLGAETVTAVSFQHLIRPDTESVYTDLLNLQPLPISALKNQALEEIYAQRFQFFNPMQTQIFHTLYHTPANVLLGSPTGSGKTVAAELAMWWAFRERPGSKVVYIAPMKALVRERVKDWGARLARPLGLRLVELTGDNTPDTRTIQDADIIVTTPEKWDGISRSWQTRGYVRKVSLVIIDEIHLLAGDRGPILEIIVSRMNYIASSTKQAVRLLGMSTACANASDLANWLGVKEGLFNFRHSVRPVPLELYIDGFPEVRGFCPLMQSMNRPTFLAVKNHSPDKPVIVFVPSRRQTRLTAKDLINYCGMEENPRRFLHMEEDDLQLNLSRVKDDALKEAISFGIALHHAGLVESDRQLAEELFLNNKIQILVATSTLAWGVNLPAHLVVVKGTQFYDAKIEGYKDMDLTDVLQMLGRAGRPQFDNSGVARIFTQDSKKDFYKHFLHTGFPVESSLHTVLDNHLCAEVSAETVVTKQDALDYLTWTFFFRRLHKNPSYYGLEIDAQEHNSTIAQQLANEHMIHMVETSLGELKESRCVDVYPNGDVDPTPLGKIMSYYYLSHKTIRHLVKMAGKKRKTGSETGIEDVLSWMSGATEYDELPVRHNEDLINVELAKNLPLAVGGSGSGLGGLPMWDPHVKAYLLLQGHMERLPLPITDYVGDQTSVLDQAIRIIQASIDVLTELGGLRGVLQFIRLLQCVKMAKWPTDPPLSILPGVDENKAGKTSLMELSKMRPEQMQKFCGRRAAEFMKAAAAIPNLQVSVDDLRTDGLAVVLRRLNPITEREGRIYAPKFPKPQTEGWFVVVADTEGDEVIAVKRVGWSGGGGGGGGNYRGGGRVGRTGGGRGGARGGRGGRGGNDDRNSRGNNEENDGGNSGRKGGDLVGTKPTARALIKLPATPGMAGKKVDILVLSDGYLGMEYAIKGVEIPLPPAPKDDGLDKKGGSGDGKRVAPLDTAGGSK